MYDYNYYNGNYAPYSGGSNPSYGTYQKNKTGKGYNDHYYTRMVMSENAAPYTGRLADVAPRKNSHPISSHHSSNATSTSSGYTPAPKARVFTHNPYASLCPTSTDTSTTFDSQPMAPLVYADPQVYEDNNLLASNVTEQFLACVGSIPTTACTPRGRHLLSSVLSMQHVDKIDMILQELLPCLNTVILDPNGCNVVRQLLVYLTTPQVEVAVGYLQRETVLQMALASQHTRRVLQTIFEQHRSEAFTPLVAAMAEDAVQLACHQQGCIAVMRVIEHGTPSQKELLTHALLPALPSLTMDPYGNYVVQCILQNRDSHTNVAMLCAAYRGHWVRLCCHKFASNVMEKVIGLLPPEERAITIEDLVFNEKNLHRLLLDSYGNFVLQSIVSSSLTAEELWPVYQTIMDSIHLSPYGNKINAKLSAKYRELIGTPEPRRTGKERQNHYNNNQNARRER
ncbi:pumilio/PUF RNA binding protein 5 [Angomonas deanei]|uniref:Pumilio-family RNA binding repeat, putative n=1 Tax=Angomonas deanei TaxID=59799 RepID=A0A7G2CM51_9TRYP|nr:pumilio/PUF RNA binding protein 5 [Angomonas deanei]CAD2220137.1 Pumilio-family RNA binding repeat, putative [Angomonas deanei]|eukprot:EPY32297.1 pumilio/PUF RNA binding protein 5 [Angomonas deanei]